MPILLTIVFFHNAFIKIFIINYENREKAQQAKLPAFKTDDQSLIPKTQIMEVENQFWMLFSDFPIFA